jgi:hypothetical protein
MSKLYYTPPSNKIFKEVKLRAIEIWKKYDNTYGYADEKINRIKDMKNIEDNMMYIVAMFDLSNQIKLINKLSIDARNAIKERMLDGSQNLEY